MSFKRLSVDTTVEDIIEALLYHEAGIVPLNSTHRDVKKLLAQSGLSPEEQRKVKRKFRKLWRTLGKVTPRHFERRQRSSGDLSVTGPKQKKIGRHNRRAWAQLWVGVSPHAGGSTERKRVVSLTFRMKAINLRKHFTDSLRAHEPTVQASSIQT